MKREIKFRAYVSHVNSGMIFLDALMRVTGALASDYQLSDIKEDAIMAYSGLKDINGVDIYEGDIIITPNHNWGVVVVKDHCFEVTVSGDQSSLYTKEFLQSSKVIGNIYENAELLNR